jgi:hypothetical protein
MDANPMRSDDMNDLERRLSAWKPAGEGLDDAAMLFAAGRASARQGVARLVWPIVTGCLALTVVALSAGLMSERSQRLALLATLDQQRHEPAPAGTPLPYEEPTTGEPASDGYLALLKAWERLPADGTSRSSAPTRLPPPSEPTILRAWQPAGPNDPL